MDIEFKCDECDNELPEFGGKIVKDGTALVKLCSSCVGDRLFLESQSSLHFFRDL